MDVIRDARTEVSWYATNLEAVLAAAEVMRELALAGAVDPVVRATAIRAVAGCPDRDRACEFGRLTAWIRDRLRFRSDPVHLDTVSAPRFTLEAGGGDCDDLAAAWAACYMAIGGEVLFLLGSSRPGAREPTHVLPAGRVGSSWHPAEVTSSHVPIGHLPPGFRVLGHVPVTP